MESEEREDNSSNSSKTDDEPEQTDKVKYHDDGFDNIVTRREMKDIEASNVQVSIKNHFILL